MAKATEGTSKTNLVAQISLLPQVAWQRIQLGVSGFNINLFMTSLAAALFVLAPVAYFTPPYFVAVITSDSPNPAAQHNKELADAKARIRESRVKKPENYNDREKQAVATNNAMGNEPLGPAPIEALEEKFGEKKIPTLSADGRKPWYVYSRPFDNHDPRPRIGLVVTGLGLSRILTDNAISKLAGEATLVFSSATPAVGEWMARARSQGHETILDIQMEPLDYPASDPGPNAILTKNGEQENSTRLKNMLANGVGYVGLTTFSGSRLTSSPTVLKPLLEETNNRGLMFLDARLSERSSAFALGNEIDLPTVATDITIHPDMGSEEILALFTKTEEQAKQKGKAIIVAHVSPLVLRHLFTWVQTLEAQGFALAPVTALTDQ